jgi:L-histidine Nalpha-methyltransferase
MTMILMPFAVTRPVTPPGRLQSYLAPQRIDRHIDSPFARDVIVGLSRPQKSVPCTWLYDLRGSELFEQITRIEIGLLEKFARSIAALAGPRATLVELGSGSNRKTPILLAALEDPAAYVPIDISVECLSDSICALQAAFPHIPIRPIFGDLRAEATLHALQAASDAPQNGPDPGRRGGRRLGFFPGSTIGNFEPAAAVTLLERIGRMLGDDAMLVIGVDSTVDRSLLMPAYDDRGGVTAAFNRNLLIRINRELEGRFDPMAFEHRLHFDPVQRRLEMHLVSRGWNEIEVLGRRFVFAAGESIHTENSYKYSPVRFQALARRANWHPVCLWTDARSRFGVHVLARSPRQ